MIVYKYQGINFAGVQPYTPTLNIETSQEMIERIKQVGLFKF